MRYTAMWGIVMQQFRMIRSRSGGGGGQRETKKTMERAGWGGGGWRRSRRTTKGENGAETNNRVRHSTKR